MAGTATRVDLLTRVRRKLRPRDDGASSVVSFIVGTSVFVLSTTVLLNFVARPPSSPESLMHESLKGRATDTLQVLLGTPGYPATWARSVGDINNVTRLGLLESGTSIRIDPAKFDALARGKFIEATPYNGAVDFDEARRTLGLTGYDFHLRAAPAFDPNSQGTWGIEGMQDYHVAYIGNWAGAIEQPESKSERFILDSYQVAFTNVTRTSVIGLGDAFKDDPSELRSLLVPLLGVEAILSGDSGANKFHVINATDYDERFNATLRPTLSRALALTDGSDPATLGYTKGKSVQATLGPANFAGLATATLTWKEYVDTDKDTGATRADYGVVEASADGGATWIPLTNTEALRSSDHWVPFVPNDTWRSRAVVISSVNCAPCMDNPQVFLRFNWFAEAGSGTTGYGWIVDEVAIAPTASTGFHKTFERPEYDLVVFGSNIDHEALTPAEVKNAIRDYVGKFGGRILVLGGEQNTNWIQPLFHVGTRGASPGIATPDTTHPLITVPNALDYETYGANGRAWDFSSGQDADLFHTIVEGSSPNEILLTTSRLGAFGDDPQAEGAVTLTSYLPYTMKGDEPYKFLANVIVYGKYHYLYIDIGPEVPSGIPVAAASRTATMDKTRDDTGLFTEIVFTLYVWPGNTTGALGTSGVPTPPRSLVATPGNGTISLTWNAPVNNGASTLQGYRIYRGSLGGYETHYAGVFSLANRTWIDRNVVNGQTYYYNLTAVNADGQSGTSNEASATPGDKPMVPLAFNASGAVGRNTLTWTSPWSSNGAPINGYNVYRNVTGQPSTMAHYTSLGVVTSWDDVGIAGTPYKYQVAAVNSFGEGPKTAIETTTGVVDPPSVPLNVVAAGGYRNITVTWAAPSTNPQGATYDLYAGNAPDPTTLLAGGLTNFTWIERGLGDGATRHYRLTASNAFGTSAYSPSVSATTLTIPSAPATLAVTQNGAGTLRLTWTPPVDTGGIVTAYKIWGGGTSGGETHIATLDMTTVPPPPLVYDDTGLGNGVRRYYYVTAVNPAGESPPSVERDGTTINVPGAATISASRTSPTKVTITVVPPTDNGGSPVANYTLYRCASVTPCTTVAIADMGLQLAYQDSPVTNGVTYWYQVTAWNAAGQGSRSNLASA